MFTVVDVGNFLKDYCIKNKKKYSRDVQQIVAIEVANLKYNAVSLSAAAVLLSQVLGVGAVVGRVGSSVVYGGYYGGVLTVFYAVRPFSMATEPGQLAFSRPDL